MSNEDERPLRIVQCGFTEGRGGMENVIPLLSRGLAQKGHRVLLLTDGNRFRQSVTQADVEHHVVALSHRGIASFLRCAAQVRRHISRFRPDVVHVHARSQSLAFLLAGRKPDWLTLHSTQLTHSYGRLDSGWIRRHLSPTARRVFTICEEAYDYVHNQLGFHPDDIEFVSNGVDCDSYRPPSQQERAAPRRHFGVDEHDILAIYVGRFHEQKRPEVVVRLAQAARDAGLTDVKFAMVGEGVLEPELRKQIERAGLQDTCRLYPWMESPVEAYWAGDLFVMPSLYEGFGLAPAEALACGCPVLRTRTGGWTQMIIEGVTGFSSAVDENDFLDVGLRALGDRTKLMEMRTTARDHAVQFLSVERQVEATLKAYRTLLSKKRKG